MSQFLMASLSQAGGGTHGFSRFCRKGLMDLYCA